MIEKKEKINHQYVNNIEVTYDEMYNALVESLRLQAHYAKLLNQWDGGLRNIFTSTGEWINRLRQLNEKKS